MADPSSRYVPHIIGVLLDSNGVAYTQVVAHNTRTGDRLVKTTDGNKRVLFNIGEFTSGYEKSDKIYFENVGGSVGSGSVTVNSATGGFQLVNLTCAAAPTVSINL